MKKAAMKEALRITIGILLLIIFEKTIKGSRTKSTINITVKRSFARDNSSGFAPV